MLLLAFPKLKQESGPVLDALRALGADRGDLTEWRRLVNGQLQPEDSDQEF